jgi:pyruvate formate lyase activating enzyme
MRDVNGRLMHTVDSTLCIGSGECLKVCCYHALSLVGQRVSSDQVAQRILKDSRYFTVSEERGGVTFSGGEPMLHVPFILELVKKIPGIHICMETSGYAGRKAFEEVMPVVDLFLFDYKVTDAELHRRLCGADNTMILENLEYLYEQGKDIILRLPLIPSVNDTDEHFDGIAGIMKRYPRILRAEIMPYHTYGLAKSGELGLEPSALLPRQGATDEMVDTWLEKLAERGCTKVCRS